MSAGPDYAKAHRIIGDTLNITLCDPQRIPITVRILTDLMLEFAACSVESCKSRAPVGFSGLVVHGVCDDRAAEIRAQKLSAPPQAAEPSSQAPPINEGVS